MKIVTVNLPDSYIELITRISSRTYASRSELLRVAIKQFLLKEMGLAKRLEKELEKIRITHFFNYCINCERKLDSLAGKNHKFHRNFEIFELKFCCSCYKKFKNKSFDEFPVYLINRIQRKVKAYKSYKEQDHGQN